MKKLFSILALLAISQVYAQQNPIPNWNMDEWIDFGDFEDPADWGSNNYITAGFGVKPVESDTISIQGLSAKMVTKEGPGFNVPGVLCSNGYFDINVLGCVGGFPCDYPFIYFNGFAMYNPEDNDTAGAGAILWKWNSGTQKRDTLALVAARFVETGGDFEFFSVPFYYSSAGVPDSAMIVLSSTVNAGQSPPAGSKLRIDNLSFSDLATGISESQPVDVSIYPNPANDYVNIGIPPAPGKYFVTVFDYLGRRVAHGLMPANQYRLQTDGLNPGLYFLSISNDRGKKIATASFEVQK
jgi:hypothetical protein